jgi:hypothetical protein
MMWLRTMDEGDEYLYSVPLYAALNCQPYKYFNNYTGYVTGRVLETG